ncbi:MAG: protein tyrosine kinase modulator [Bryobacterales bacterium]|nr:protein tyrosine kinase modulator [Bryobacterales bacterium]
MQITPAQISEDLVKTTGNQLLTDRIIQMEGDILSRRSLSDLIQAPELNLYPKERAKQPLEDVIEMMKSRDLKIDVQNMANLGKHASAFKISFSYVDRFKAQQTVSKLITRFVDANQSSQRDQQTMLHDFIGDELAKAKADLEKSNAELTKFKVENQGRLPEQSQMNIASLNSLQGQVTGVQDQLNRLAQQRIQLEAHLSTLKSQLDLIDMMAQDSSSPGMAGTPAFRQNAEVEQLNKEIDAGESHLQELLQSYREGYPDIRNLQKRLALLKKQRDDLKAKQEDAIASDAAKPKEAPRKTTNYQVAQSRTTLLGDIDQTNALLKNNDADRVFKQKEQEKVTRQIEEYRNKLSATSGIEARYADLQREQANATVKFQTMLQKQDLTAQNNDLIQRKAGEKLEVLDSPSLPITPFSPSRWTIVGGGTAASFLIGLALAGVQEAKDASLKNLKDVRAYTNLPVLCSIPLLENTLLVKRKKRITYLAWSAALVVGIVAICLSLAFYYTQTVTG